MTTTEKIGVTTRQEVEWESTKVKIVKLQKSFGGAQTAVISLSTWKARLLCHKSRLKVALMYTRIRPAELFTRCFRSHSHRNITRECTDVNRNHCFWRCEASGLQSVHCLLGASEGFHERA